MEKMRYEAPALYAELFVPNQYVAACGDTTTVIPAMKVRCQSDGHTNTAQDTIFLDSNTACVGKYNASYTDDNCHPYPQHGWNEGERSYGTGFVQGTWEKDFWGNNWFVESATGTQKAYKGYFAQGGHRHLFYATTEQASEFQGS